MTNMETGVSKLDVFSNQEGPKLSDYTFARISRPDELLTTLGQALGVRGEVFDPSNIFVHQLIVSSRKYQVGYFGRHIYLITTTYCI